MTRSATESSATESSATAAGVAAPASLPTTPASETLVPDHPLVLARFEEIAPNPSNARESLRIESLEASILEHGLLENLVGIEIPSSDRRAPYEWIELKAGSRRYEAIRRLRDKGHFPADRPIPVIMLDSRGFWQHLVENVERQNLAPWELGRRLSEAASGGLTHREIGSHIQRSAGFVMRHIQIAEGLSPLAIAFILDKRLEPKMSELYRLAFFKNPYGEPDGEKQVAELDRQVRRTRPYKARKPDDIRAFASRIRYLESYMPVPPLIRPVVDAVIKYLDGGKPPQFRQLCEKLLGDKIRFTGGLDPDDEAALDIPQPQEHPPHEP